MKVSDIRALVQTTLDTALYPNVYVYWQRKSNADVDEYVVYTQSGDNRESFADDTVNLKAASITVKYYYRTEKLDTYAGKQAVKAREDAIETALENAGFTIPLGKFDAGDVDDIGFFVTVFECEYWRAV
jgi:hypothetical protein